MKKRGKKFLRNEKILIILAVIGVVLLGIVFWRPVQTGDVLYGAASPTPSPSPKLLNSFKDHDDGRDYEIASYVAMFSDRACSTYNQFRIDWCNCAQDECPDLLEQLAKQAPNQGPCGEGGCCPAYAEERVNCQSYCQEHFGTPFGVCRKTLIYISEENVNKLAGYCDCSD